MTPATAMNARYWPTSRALLPATPTTSAHTRFVSALRPASCPTSSTRAKENLPEDGETLELVEDVVDGVMRDVGAGDRASRPGRIGDAHLCGARDREIGRA